MAIIENSLKEILLVKRKFSPYRGYWALPGGFLQYGENPKDALKRELKEELGINNPEILDLLSSYEEFYEFGGEKLCATVIVFKVAVSSKEHFLAEDDVEDFKFFNKERLPEKIAFKNLNSFLKNFKY